MTDIITLILSFMFFIYGAARGFIKSLLVPFSIIVATIICVIYYAATQDMVVTLIIGLLGPILINFLLKILLKKIAKATNREIKPDFLSRFGGGVVTFIWGWIFIIFTLILVAVLPPWGKPMEAIHHDVTHSASYFFAKPLGEALFGSSQTNTTIPSKNSTNADAKSMANDPRFQKVLQDPQVQQDIESKNMAKLISNPKVMELTSQIMSDPAMLKKVMALYSAQAQQSDFIQTNSSN